MMESVITALALIGSLGSCSTIHSNIVSPDVIHNRELNTTEINADGHHWEMMLPPNYRILLHKFNDGAEKMSARSRFLVGRKFISLSVTAIAMNGSSPDELYVAAHEEVIKVDGWKQVWGPVPIEQGGKLGFVDVGIINESIMTQFTFVAMDNGYVLQCAGDVGAKVRVISHCKELLDRFQPTSGD